MHFSITMSRYLGRQFLISVLAVFVVFSCIALIADLVELLRRTSDKDEIGAGLIAAMAVLKLPTISMELAPFAVLFGAMATFLRLTRNHELVVARAAGVSVWQFLAPALIVALAFGAAMVTVYNPIAATMSGQYERLEAKHLRGRTSLVAVSSSGLWLRQADEQGQSVIHALRVSERGLRLADVIIFLYGPRDEFVGRIDAESAVLMEAEGYWDLTDAWITKEEEASQFHERYRQPTSLTITQVQESFASPATISFWDLPRFIELAEAAGFSAKRYRLHWYSLLATPFLLCTMVLIGATFSLRVRRLGGVTQLVLAGMLSGFLLFFLSDLSLALGISGIVPPFLAAWSPAFIAMLLGLAALFHLEDG